MEAPLFSPHLSEPELGTGTSSTNAAQRQRANEPTRRSPRREPLMEAEPSRL